MAKASLRVNRRRQIAVGLDAFLADRMAKGEDVMKDIGETVVQYTRSEFTHMPGTTGRGFTNRKFAKGDPNSLNPSIYANAVVVDFTVVLKAGARMGYASYVENMKNGKYAYLKPAIQELLPGIQDLLRTRMRIEGVR